MSEEDDTNRFETILDVGAEGGSITLAGRRDERGAWQFRVATNKAALYDLLDEEPSAPVKTPWVSWDAALALLGRYPWPRLSPIKLHAEFANAILEAVAASKDGGPLQVARWRDWLAAADRIANEKPRGAMNEIVAADGLHRIKDEFQKTYMALQCDVLVRNLDAAIDATLKQAPIRRTPKKYLIDRKKVAEPKRAERSLEDQIYRRWSDVICDPVRGCWHRIIAFRSTFPTLAVKGEAKSTYWDWPITGFRSRSN
jgi:hypothetical protein